jgi:hypothetical protein
MSATGEVSYGFAKYLRDALPHASFIGFTGTPIEAGDVNTPAVFGSYIDIYDISRAVADGATVPIYYESRLARIELDPDEKPTLDAEIAELKNTVRALVSGFDQMSAVQRQTTLVQVLQQQTQGAVRRLLRLQALRWLRNGHQPAQAQPRQGCHCRGDLR